MAFTTANRLKDYIRQSGSGFHFAINDDAITNAVNGANAELENEGVVSSQTDAGLLYAADRLAMSYLLEGYLVSQALRGELQAAGSMRLLIEQMRKGALETAQKYVSLSLRTTKGRRNRNWAFNRGGPLRFGSEAGSRARTGDSEL